MTEQTPSQTIGPFFSYGLITGNENHLVNAHTSGTQINIVGRLFDGDKNTVEDGLIEIWQADAQGYFNHPVDPNQSKADPHFSGFGRSETVNEGEYAFMTVKPGAIALNQAPYINIRIFARGMLIHAVTRLYFSDEAANDIDPVLNGLDEAQRKTLIAHKEPSLGLPTYRFDIILQGEDETVFFDV
ncbi:MAG: protocatechuate 3,4-dioxygenase subunit alpha [Chloroflexota bacterium]